MNSELKDWASGNPSCELLIELRANTMPSSFRQDIAACIGALYKESPVNAFSLDGGGRLQVITEMPNLKTQALQFGDQLKTGGQTLLSERSSPNRIDLPFDETCFLIDAEKARAKNVAALAHALCEVRFKPDKYLLIKRSLVPDASNLPTLAQVEGSLLKMLSDRYKASLGPWYLYEFYSDSGPSGESRVNLYGVSRSGKLSMLYS